LIDFYSHDVIWDSSIDDRSEYDSIIGASQRMELTSMSRYKMTGIEKSKSENSDVDYSEQSQWIVGVSSEGILSRNGELGDPVAWKIEHEGKIIMTKNTHNSTTFQFSRDLPITAWSTPPRLL
jgi:hypothetical protein